MVIWTSAHPALSLFLSLSFPPLPHRVANHLRHPYVTHVILNAGLAVWTGINWPLAVWMILTNLPRAVTWPKYKNQRAGDVGADGYGWVWQCNLGAHYILVSRARATIS